jgi:hypothetical protein
MGSATSYENVAVQHRQVVEVRKKQLMDDSRRTQDEIRRLQDEARVLQIKMTETPATRANFSADLRPLYQALENTQKKEVVVMSKNSIAARKAREEQEVGTKKVVAPARPTIAPQYQQTMPNISNLAANKPSAPKIVSFQQPKMDVPPARRRNSPREITPPKVASKKKIVAARDGSEHNYSYGEENSDAEPAADDPYLKAANKEFEAARKAFELAEKTRSDAKKKQDDRIKK